MIIRIVAGVLIVALLALQYRLWLSPNGMRDLWRTKAAIEAQAEENARLAERNRTLAAEVRDLKEGRAAIEERARTDLGKHQQQASDVEYFEHSPLLDVAAAAYRRCAAQTQLM